MTTEDDAVLENRPALSAELRSFLLRHPDYFLSDPELFHQLTLPHLGLGSASSLLERQIRQLRQERDHLQGQIDALLVAARDNASLAIHLGHLALRLMTARDGSEVVSALWESLQTDFQVEALALAIPADGPHLSMAIQVTDWTPLDTPDQRPSTQLELPDALRTALFGNAAASLASFAAIPLGGKRIRGVILLGSQDPDRYGPDLGTALLEQIGLLAGSALERCHLESAQEPSEHAARD